MVILRMLLTFLRAFASATVAIVGGSEYPVVLAYR
jgi:hypothetical protein